MPEVSTKKRVRPSAKALIIRNDKILLLKCQKGEHLYYNLPGGGQNFGERIDEALIRECWEEAGAKVQVKNLVFVRDYISKHHSFSDSKTDVHQLELIFTCELLGPDHPEGGPEPDDYQIGVEWIAIDQLNTITLYPTEIAKYLPLSPSLPEEVYLGDVN